jgi:hypothetical protein
VKDMLNLTLDVQFETEYKPLQLLSLFWVGVDQNNKKLTFKYIF